jgi:acylphosphatase
MRTLVAVATGRVQGVGYRDFVQRLAVGLGLAGWVFNTPKGDVEVEAQGEQRALDQLAAAMEKGPSLAHVTGVRVTWTERPAYHDFRIRW